MATTFTCANPERLQRLRSTAAANAIDHLVVVDGEDVPQQLRQRVVLVRLLTADGVDAIDTRNVRIHGGVRVVDPGLRWAVRLADLDPDTVDPSLSSDQREHLSQLRAERAATGDQWLIAMVEQRGDHSRYRLLLRDGTQPPEGFDPVLSEIEFSFVAACPWPFDCELGDDCPTEPIEHPELDYLARDFASFRQLMFDRMALLAPDDASRHAAELRTTLVETVAYVADQLAYFQDAVATEAYLGTCRTRPSLRRHARALGYRVRQGCNARTFIHLELDDHVEVGGTPPAAGSEPVAPLRPGTMFLTRLSRAGPVVAPVELAEALAEGPAVFEAVEAPLWFTDAHNTIAFHTWGDEDCCLQRGATEADVVDDGRLRLSPGDFVVLEQTRAPRTGIEADADPERRHVVRLVTISEPLTDPLEPDLTVRRLRWHDDDALTFPLVLTLGELPVAVARANLVLADHGHTVVEPSVPLEHWGNQARIRATLARRGLTWAAPIDGAAGATTAIRQDPRAADPIVTLTGEGERWTPVTDLLASPASARAFVVEPEHDGLTRLRFGDDVLGRRPADVDQFSATYRIGNGPEGHVGAESLGHVVADVATVDAALTAAVVDVRNPVAAVGGVAAESVEEVRRDAPQAFRVQQRAVTTADWAEVAERLPGVQRAVADQRWTGSWNTVYVTVDPVAGTSFTALRDDLVAHLEPFRLAGYDIEVTAPAYAALDIVLTVCVDARHFPADVLRALHREFSTAVLPDGRRGFFHPDAFTFGDSVWLSQVIARCMAVPGVVWVDATPSPGGNRFTRWGAAQGTEVDDGRIRIGPLEIARCDNDPAAPDHGRIAFLLEGGA